MLVLFWLVFVFNLHDSSSSFQDMLEIRAKLPIADLKGEILQLLKENDVLVICGETGSGKTTQVQSHTKPSSM